jgi:hypothetical protein
MLQQLKPYPLNMIPFGDCFFIYVSKTTTIILLYCNNYNHVHNLIVTRFWNYYTNWFEILLTSLEIVWLGSVDHILVYLLVNLTFELNCFSIFLLLWNCRAYITHFVTTFAHFLMWKCCDKLQVLLGLLVNAKYITLHINITCTMHNPINFMLGCWSFSCPLNFFFVGGSNHLILFIDEKRIQYSKLISKYLNIKMMISVNIQLHYNAMSFFITTCVTCNLLLFK